MALYCTKLLKFILRSALTLTYILTTVQVLNYAALIDMLAHDVSWVYIAKYSTRTLYQSNVKYLNRIFKRNIDEFEGIKIFTGKRSDHCDKVIGSVISRQITISRSDRIPRTILLRSDHDPGRSCSLRGSVLDQKFHHSNRSFYL